MTDRVLITGGTGFFGRAFVRLALTRGASKVVVFSHTEEAQRAMRAALPERRLEFWLGDVRDGRALRAALRTSPVDAIVHAAAIKSVPACEQFPLEAVQTNVDGTAEVIDAAQEFRIEKVIGLSSDKAVFPISVYGATKALMERVLVAANFAAVRCGNLIGSTGSVLPIWREQMAQGHPITVTDRQMTRFYVSASEAASFVWHSLETMRGGEVFVPKLRACRLGDLADAVTPNQRVLGVRDGEHLHELLLHSNELVTDAGWAYIVQKNAPPFGHLYRSDLVESMPASFVVEAA